MPIGALSNLLVQTGRIVFIILLSAELQASPIVGADSNAVVFVHLFITNEHINLLCQVLYF